MLMQLTPKSKYIFYQIRKSVLSSLGLQPVILTNRGVKSTTIFQLFELLTKAGNTEHGKCRLTNEYTFFLFLIGHWYYEKNIFVFIKNDLF